MQNVIKVLSYVKNIWRQLGLLAGISVITSALGAASPYAFKIIIDEISKASQAHTSSMKVIWIALVALFVLRLINSASNYYTNLLGNRIYTRVYLNLRDIIFRQLTTLSIDYFEKTKTGEIMQRASNNVSELASWIYNTSNNFLGQVLTVLFAVILVFVVDWRAGLLITVSTVVFFTQQLPALRKTRHIGKASHKEIEKAGGYLQETVANIGTVRSFGGEEGAVINYIDALTAWRDLQYGRVKILQQSIFHRQNINSIAIVGAFAIVAYGAIHGRHTPGDILLISLYLQQITSNLWPLGRFMIDSNDIDITAERIVTMLETKPTVVDTPEATNLESIKSIEFRAVSFAYPGKKDSAIRNISFKVAAGHTTALVGPSGTGKTTITKLLLRFYEPTSGQILINDRPITSYTQDSVRRHIGVVMQDVALFNDTIEANLQLAKADAKKAAIRTAAHQAHANIFIDKLPDKYQTVVGERGVKLSGGEKQRVAIARAILKQPDMIILDEATSALDSESEQHVQAGLTQLMHGRTSLVIAHRLSTVMNADEIVVMKGGTIVERGAHAQLATKKAGLYARMYRLQTGGLLADEI